MPLPFGWKKFFFILTSSVVVFESARAILLVTPLPGNRGAPVLSTSVIHVCPLTCQVTLRPCGDNCELEMHPAPLCSKTFLKKLLPRRHDFFRAQIFKITEVEFFEFGQGGARCQHILLRFPLLIESFTPSGCSVLWLRSIWRCDLLTT